MKITYKLVLQETAPRTEDHVKCKTKQDYFLGANIVAVDGKPIQGLESLYNALKSIFPSLKFKENELKDLLTVFVQPGFDIPAIPILYFADFRTGRDVNNDLNSDVIAKARAEATGVEETFEITEKDFQLLANNLVLSNKITTVAKKVVGTYLRGKDAVLSIVLPEVMQTILKGVLTRILGEGQSLKNAVGVDIDAFSLSVAQSTVFTETLKKLELGSEKMNENVETTTTTLNS